jgi:hypothetical protein
MMIRVLLLAFAALAALAALPARLDAFCGFYVSRADTKIFNKASHVVLARDGDRTVITMANDFRGDWREFAMVVPLPTAIARDQIHVGDRAVVDHLDAFTAPRLVEYFDTDPCVAIESSRLSMMAQAGNAADGMARREQARADALGVTIEARYTVGEYDILILSAAQSTGLETWLRESGYRIPAGAADVLASYIKQRMRFFVAKVNLTEQAQLGFANLRPIQVAYESPKFVLPIRLGMVNADGAQELFIYTLTRKGRVESTNYRTVKLRTDAEIPAYIKEPAEFGRMYRALFDQQVRREAMTAVFQEYAWDMGWCDPCAADPFTPDELRRLGVFWLNDARRQSTQDRVAATPAAPDVFVTRLHVRYDKAHFPEDLVFQETGDRSNFQGRYVLRHAWTGPRRCDAARDYDAQVRLRHDREAQTLASLTGWNVEDIRRRMNDPGGGGRSGASAVAPASGPAAWWRRLWE